MEGVTTLTPALFTETKEAGCHACRRTHWLPEGGLFGLPIGPYCCPHCGEELLTATAQPNGGKQISNPHGRMVTLLI